MPRRAPARLALVAGITLLLQATRVAAATPDWVEQNGAAADYPSARFLVGFAQTTGKNEDALEAAKQQAAADLARQVSVQIESTGRRPPREEGARREDHQPDPGHLRHSPRRHPLRDPSQVEARLRLVLERLPAAVAGGACETARSPDGRLSGRRPGGRAGRSRPVTLEAYRGCRRSLDEAIEHEAVAAALSRGGLLGGDAGPTLAAHATKISTRIRAIPHEDARSIRSAAAALAVQLADAGIGRGASLVVAPLLYRGRDVSSPFGREMALALESAIGRSDTEGAAAAGTMVVRGTYAEQEPKDATGEAEARDFQLRVNAKEAATGRLLASAEVVLAGSAVPAGLATRPANFERFAEDADKLAGGDVVSGDLRIEVRTDRGSRGLVYDEGEALSLYVRVNQPAWVRLIYVLTSGDHVPITQEW